jgi:hypothetical protein
VENGELILESAQNKNITLQTMGSGRVNLNGEDLTSIIPRSNSYKFTFDTKANNYQTVNSV